MEDNLAVSFPSSFIYNRKAKLENSHCSYIGNSWMENLVQLCHRILFCKKRELHFLHQDRLQNCYTWYRSQVQRLHAVSSCVTFFEIKKPYRLGTDCYQGTEIQSVEWRDPETWLRTLIDRVKNLGLVSSILWWLTTICNSILKYLTPPDIHRHHIHICCTYIICMQNTHTHKIK